MNVRDDFPIMRRRVHERQLVYLDSAASSQLPQAVLDAVTHYQTTQHSNVHRGVHALSMAATDAFESARERVRQYLNARSSREVIFTRGTTEAINLVAASWGREQLQPGDEVLITLLEHHANIVPWQLACQATGAVLRAAPILPDGSLDMAAFVSALGPRTRLIAVTQVSNALGTVLPLAEIGALAQARRIPWLVDGAQAVAHSAIDVQKLGCDFYAFSGHKVYAPTGIGVLYGREELLRAMPPWQGGGDMIRTVAIEGSSWNDLPWKFEAGTPNISGAVGLAAALDYVSALGLAAIAAHEQELASAATVGLKSVPGLTIVGTAAAKGPVISFTLRDVHPHDIGTILDAEGIAIRSGHHCAMPLMTALGLPATARASFACYNNRADVDALISAVRKVVEVFH